MTGKIAVNYTDGKGREYRHGLFVAKAPAYGPGWYIYGRCLTDYLPDGIVTMVARPDVAPRKYPLWNGRVRRGWHTKREALAALATLNPTAGASQPSERSEHA